ncbi:MAG: thioredoxin family protein [Anaerolineae bacterium]
MIIKVLGSGCPKCQRLEELVREAVASAGVQAKIEHVRDWQEILEYQVMTTPGLVIDEKVVCSGRLPRTAEIVAWLQAAAV